MNGFGESCIKIIFNAMQGEIFNFWKWNIYEILNYNASRCKIRKINFRVLELCIFHSLFISNEWRIFNTMQGEKFNFCGIYLLNFEFQCICMHNLKDQKDWRKIVHFSFAFYLCSNGFDESCIKIILNTVQGEGFWKWNLYKFWITVYNLKDQNCESFFIRFLSTY